MCFMQIYLQSLLLSTSTSVGWWFGWRSIKVVYSSLFPHFRGFQKLMKKLKLRQKHDCLYTITHPPTTHINFLVFTPSLWVGYGDDMVHFLPLLR